MPPFAQWCPIAGYAVKCKTLFTAHSTRYGTALTVEKQTILMSAKKYEARFALALRLPYNPHHLPNTPFTRSTKPYRFAATVPFHCKSASYFSYHTSSDRMVVIGPVSDRLLCVVKTRLHTMSVDTHTGFVRHQSTTSARSVWI